MQKMKKQFRGLTLIEVLIGMFVFTTIIIATTGIFSSSFKTKSVTQDSQKRYDLAFGAIGDVGKFISTSTVFTDSSGSMAGSQSIEAYSYSKGVCVQFKFENNTLVVREVALTTAPDESYTACKDKDYTGATSRIVVDQFIDGRFIVRKLDISHTSNTTLNHSGMVTIYADVYSDDPTSGSKPITIQTTVSLRDYLD